MTDSQESHRESQLESHWDVLSAAHETLRAAVLGVSERDWALPTPCDQWNVTQVLQHAAGDQLAYASALTGQPGPAENPFAPSGVLAEPAVAVIDNALRASARAFAAVAPDAAEVPSPLPQGALPAPVAVGACALDAAVHAWDIAVATGQQARLDPDLARALMPVATSIVEPLRGYGAYAAALDADVHDDAPAELLRYLGRRPDWTAP
jgi:uncharacterized protein (TIGR03086 family)